jgi:hypothetical protein
MESEGGVKNKFPAVRPMNYRCGLRAPAPPQRSTTNARLMRALLGRGGLTTFWGLRCNLCSSRTVNISLAKAFCRHLRGVQKAFQTDRQTERQTDRPVLKVGHRLARGGRRPRTPAPRRRALENMDVGLACAFPRKKMYVYCAALLGPLVGVVPYGPFRFLCEAL